MHSLVVPGFAFRPRRIRGVTDLPVRLPAAFLFEPLAVCGLEIDILAVFLFESSSLAVCGLEIDISSLLGRGPVDVPGICGG